MSQDYDDVNRFYADTSTTKTEYCVLASDYDKLRAEVERLKEELDEITTQFANYQFGQANP